MESLRAFGYTPETAIADLVDNSVTAQAKLVWIEFDWDGETSRIAIGDNGKGMTEATLVQAMRPGSTSPSEARSADDLGRFGLGLKTASFSQCRQLTVMTKTKRTGIHTRRWELTPWSHRISGGFCVATPMTAPTLLNALRRKPKEPS